MYNEVCVIITNYHMLLFTDYIYDANLKFSVGWSLITLTLVMIIGNVTVMISA